MSGGKIPRHPACFKILNRLLEFLDLVRTNDVEKLYETPLGQKAKERIREVRSDKTLEVSYMTYAQKIIDERQRGYDEGHEEALKDAIVALKDVLDPTVIAERFKMSLEQVMNILGQK